MILLCLRCRKRSARVKRMWENVEEPTRVHCLNFVECLRSRKKPNADIEIGHRSTTIALLGNIAMKTGKKLHWDAGREDLRTLPMLLPCSPGGSENLGT